MAKNLLIGVASNYNWEDLAPWVNSAKKHEPDCEIRILGHSLSEDTVSKLVSEGVIVTMFQKSNFAPHVERFFHIWNEMSKLEPSDYKTVLTTDTRDVFFQTPFFSVLDIGLDLDEYADHKLICFSEELTYSDEPWGKKNFIDTFGQFFYEKLVEDIAIYNVGVIGGDFRYVRDMMLSIFQMSINRAIPIVDQAVFNLLIQTEPFCSVTQKMSGGFRGCINLGTTLQAVEAGNGDIGLMAKQNPFYLDEYKRNYMADQPVIENGEVYLKYSNVSQFAHYAIVHQYDRIPGLEAQVRKLYG